MKEVCIEQQAELPFTDSIRLFEDILMMGVDLRVRATGRSMIPFLQGGEILTIRKVPSSSLRRGDLIFLRTSEGYPLMHRIIKIQRQQGHAYFCTKGDALITPDAFVREDRVLGKVITIESARAWEEPRALPMDSPLQRCRGLAVVLTGRIRTVLYRILSRLSPVSFRVDPDTSGSRRNNSNKGVL